MAPQPNEFEQLRGFQIGLQDELSRQYDDLKLLTRQISSLKDAIASASETTGTELIDIHSGLESCVQNIRRLNRCVNNLNERLQVLEKHPSNGPIEQWHKLSPVRTGGYVGGLGAFMGGVVLLIAARRGTVEAFGAKFTAPEMSAAGMVAAAGGIGFSGWAVAKKENSE